MVRTHLDIGPCSFGTKVLKKEVNKLRAVSWKRHVEILTTEERLTDVGLLTLNLKSITERLVINYPTSSLLEGQRNTLTLGEKKKKKGLNLRTNF